MISSFYAVPKDHIRLSLRERKTRVVILGFAKVLIGRGGGGGEITFFFLANVLNISKKNVGP